ncbi:MAG TPA: leucyl aminopeptidase [Patescibacteria group bacterium]|nr:leucyl aminopeptidase [Patescibacteria group bacterium]
MGVQAKVVSGEIGKLAWDALLIGVFSGATDAAPEVAAVDMMVGGCLLRLLKDTPDMTKWGENTVIPVCSGERCQRVIVIGLGKPEELNYEKLRAAMGTAMRSAGKLQARIVASLLHRQCTAAEVEMQTAAQGSVEGALMGAYRFDCYKTAPVTTTVPEEFWLLEESDSLLANLEQAAYEGQTIAEAVNMTRDLVNHPAGHMTPTRLAEQAARIADVYGMNLTVMDREELAVRKMGAFLAVAQGSVEPPKMIVLKHCGAGDTQPWTAFVGKGITFDSGGISLKPSENMGDMKDDMAGAAAVLGAMEAIGRLGIKQNIMGVMPCTENMPAGNAFHPGDVITSMDGKTIEVISTDAEGRLILADAVTYAKELGAERLVDVATLTGACVIALGKVYSGLLGNNREWTEQVRAAATAAGEKVWEMPYDAEYREQFKSSIADLKNTGGRPGGMITAGMFIGEFAGQTPWVHIDIAATVTADKDQGYLVKGATGVLVRTLVQLARSGSN